MALQSRGFGSHGKRTSRRVLRLRTSDWVFVVCAWGILIGLSQV
jgi:energy-coupling factor transporter transmembrane protein EcfT